MISTSIVVFCGALVGLCLLFSVRALENSKGTLVAPGLHEFLDQRARYLKSDLRLLGRMLERVPGLVLIALRQMLHVAAVQAAGLASAAESKFYNLADKVSHKHRFERRETSSQFLKEVTTGTNGLVETKGISEKEIVG